MQEVWQKNITILSPIDDQEYKIKAAATFIVNVQMSPTSSKFRMNISG